MKNVAKKRAPLSRAALAVVIAMCLFSSVAATGAAQEKIELQFAGRYSSLRTNLAPAYELFVKFMDEYVTLNPYIEFEYIEEPADIGWMDTLLVRAAAFGLPDIVFLPHAWLADFYMQGAFRPIPEGMLARLTADLHPATMIGTQVNGVTYGVPGEVQVTGLMYNEQLLQEMGVSGAPETWDELVLLTQRMPRNAEGAYVHLPLGVNGGGWGWTGNYLAILNAYGGYYLDDQGRIALDSPLAIDVMTKMGEWFGPAGFASSSRTRFLSGDGYFGIGYPWWMTFFKSYGQTSESIAANFRVGPMPAGSVRHGEFLYGESFFVSNDSDHPDEAWRFLEWMALDRTGREITRLDEVMGVALGSLPMHRDDLANVDYFEYGPYYRLFGENLANAVAEPVLPNGVRRQDLIAEAITAVIRGEMSPVEASINLAQLSRALGGL